LQASRRPELRSADYATASMSRRAAVAATTPRNPPALLGIVRLEPCATCSPSHNSRRPPSGSPASSAQAWRDTCWGGWPPTGSTATSEAINDPLRREACMSTVAVIGLNLAKRLFQVHGVDAAGAVVLRKRLRRDEVLVFFSQLPPCRIGMEACGTAHHWGRELRALGHAVLLMPPQSVKPYVKRNKDDAADAEAICEAVQRPSMRFVPIKTVDQQAILVLHRSRDLLVRQRTALVNARAFSRRPPGCRRPTGCARSAWRCRPSHRRPCRRRRTTASASSC